MVRLALLAIVVAVLGSCSKEDPTEGGAEPEVANDAGTAERCARPPCADGERCQTSGDCASGVCSSRTCFPSTAGDRIRNGGETGVDCGGPPTGAPRCAAGETCGAGTDCESQVCGDSVCQPPSSRDALRNGTETDVDCGGGAPTNAPRCAPGKACATTPDCDAVLCTDGICQTATNADGLRNGSETDVDCGGAGPTNARRCGSGQTCAVTADCDAVACAGGVCQPPTGTDAIRNGSETDVDCGGGAPTNAPRCAVDKSCTRHEDCASSACAETGPKAGKCVPFKSCVRQEGGFTCGRDDRERGSPTGVVQHESCCETAAVPGVTTRLNRFAITAGRMRAFIERLDGNVRRFVQTPATKPAGWSASWDALVPSSRAEAEIMLGSYWNNAPNDPNRPGREGPHSKRSCGNDNYNGHTYWVTSESAAEQVFSREVLDQKVLNCVGWHLVTAFCAWDGGRLATQNELRRAFRNGTSTAYPWLYAGSPYTQPYDAGVQDERLNHKYNYGFPGNTPFENRITWWLSPPGRFWRGWNANRIEIAGNILEWTSDAEYNFAWNLSFENHTGSMNDGGDWRTPNDRDDVPNGYYALGARCAY